MASVVSDTTSTMATNLQRQDAELQRHQDFVIAVESLSSRIMEELRKANLEVQSTTKNLLQSFASTTQDLITRIVGQSQGLGHHLEELRVVRIYLIAV
jgi:hypothetical protein